MIAKEHNITSFDIEMDSLLAINILNNDLPLYSNIVSECKILLEELGATKPLKILREQNAVPDCLAKEGTRIEYLLRPTVATHVPPFLPM